MSLDLKLAELLSEVKLDPSALQTLDRTLASIAAAIKATPPCPVSADALPAFVRDLGASAEKIKFAFRPPEVVTVAGSVAIGAVAKPEVNGDLLVRMPKECFYDKDYLNHKYHARRCLYLSVIERHLKSSSLVRKIEWSTFQNEARKPVLLVYPETDVDELSRFFVRIIPTCTSVFDVSRLNVQRNNVRSVNKGGVTLPTPKYNTSILEDMFLEENAKFVGETFDEWKGLDQALILLKVWARQRSSIYSHDSLNGFLLSFILSYLASGVGEDRITKEMNHFQVFRVTLNFIATSKIWNKGIFLQSPGQRQLSQEEKRFYQQLFGVILCDLTGHVNLAFRVTKAAFMELKNEAELSLKCIEKCKDGGFEEIFMTKVDLPAKFDYCARLNLKENTKMHTSTFCLDDEHWRICEQKVHSILQQALNDRARLIRVMWKNTPCHWDVKDGFSKFLKEPMYVGVLVSSCEKSDRMVDVGPNADDKVEAAKFRNFWGDRAELRRFQDGRIAESTVWKCETWKRHLIVENIVDFVLHRHFLISAEDTIHAAGQLDFCLLHRDKDPVSFSEDLLTSFNGLSKRLRLLEDIPLKVSSVQPLDPAFRKTSVFPPEPHPLAFVRGVDLKSIKFASTCIQPVEIVIQLEGSGNWPLDEVAVEKTKSAFLLKIAESLQDRWGIYYTATEKDVDVLLSGFAFRLRILHERALSLLSSPVTKNAKIRGVSSWDKELFFRSQHASMIDGLNGCYRTYGPVVRLAKRWITSHLFSSFLSEEAIELIVAYIFLKPFPFNFPCSRVSGFLRFLRLLATFDWIFTPMIVDINNDLSSKDERDIFANFNTSRKSYGEDPQNVMPAMFLATSYDRCSEAWTKNSPNTMVLKRMAAYASSSAQLLTKLILHGQSGSYIWECLFRTPMNNYDAIVLLHREKLSHPQRLLFPNNLIQGTHVIRGDSCKDFQPYMPLEITQEHLATARDKLMVDFDPTRCFIEDLKCVLPGTCRLWYDSLGGDAIGLTWEEKGSKKRDREESDEVKRDIIDMLKNVGETGKGFVRDVYLLKVPRLAG